MKTNSVAIGRNLKIKTEEETPVKSAPIIDKREEAIASADEKSKGGAVDMDYVVVAGDNLGSIAKKFGTTIAELKELNNLTSNNIGLGKTIIISAAIIIEEPASASTAIASNSVDSFKKKQFLKALVKIIT